MSLVLANGQPATHDAAEIRRSLDVLFEPGDVVELRVPNGKRTTGGYFSDFDKLAEAAQSVTNANAYVTLNRIRPDLLARRANRVDFADKTTADADVTRRRWLGVDLDHARPSGISATDGEHKAALAKAREIAHWLYTEHGWAESIVGDSGNGAWILYRIDEPNDPETAAVIQRVLQRLSLEFDEPAGVHVDQTVYNAARIVKLFGTVARKGDSTPDRPHRPSRLLETPEFVGVVTREQLETFAGPPEPPRTGDYQRNGRAPADFDPAAWLAQHVEVTAEGAYTNQNGAVYRWKLAECPLCGETDRSAVVLKFGDGRIGYRCHHNRCAGRGWQDLREHFEPGYRDRREHEPKRQGMPNWMPAEERGEPDPAPIVYQRLTCSDLASGDFSAEFIIEGVMTAGEPLVEAGSIKTCKTSISIDAAISIAHGGYFLGKFPVTRPRRVLGMIGESGLPTVQETALRVAAAAGVHLHELDNLLWSPDIPKLSNLRHLDALEAFLKTDDIEVLFLDPAYLAMPSQDAGNLFAQGELLRGVADICRQVGVTMILAHHTKRNTLTPRNEPPELTDIAWSGFAEFARQWWLIGRREKYQPGSGEHKLWLSVGGSAGHGGLWGVDISEGAYSPYASRRWDVTVTPGGDVLQTAGDDEHERREREREEREQRRLEDDKQRVVDAMQRVKRAETKSHLADAAQISNTRCGRAILALVDDGHVREAVVERANKQTYQGYELCQ